MVGVGKEEDWEGRTKGVTLTCGSQQHGWRCKIELLYHNGGLKKESDHADCLMKQAMCFMMEAFQTLKAREAPGHVEKEDRKPEETVC